MLVATVLKGGRQANYVPESLAAVHDRRPVTAPCSHADGVARLGGRPQRPPGFGEERLKRRREPEATFFWRFGLVSCAEAATPSAVPRGQLGVVGRVKTTTPNGAHLAPRRGATFGAKTRRERGVARPDRQRIARCRATRPATAAPPAHRTVPGYAASDGGSGGTLRGCHGAAGPHGGRRLRLQQHVGGPFRQEVYDILPH